jgi:hypothetical protein
MRGGLNGAGQPVYPALVIDAELDMDGSIPATAIGGGWNYLMPELTSFLSVDETMNITEIHVQL